MVKAKSVKNTGNAGKGRPKGSKNKTTVHAKEAIEAAFEAIGGAKRLKKWILADSKNESAFFVSIYPKLLPIQAMTPPPADEKIKEEFL